jgi:hypothetical protein
MPERPSRMFANGRKAVQDFAAKEQLYMRYNAEQMEGDHLAPAAIKTKQSVNRSRFSEPGDAVFGEHRFYAEGGVMQISVEDVPEAIEGEQGSKFRFFPRHVPLNWNYAHSEVWSDSFNTPSADGFREASRSAKTAFRVQFAKKLTVVIEAPKSQAEAPKGAAGLDAGGDSGQA